MFFNIVRTIGISTFFLYSNQAFLPNFLFLALVFNRHFMMKSMGIRKNISLLVLFFGVFVCCKSKTAEIEPLVLHDSKVLSSRLTLEDSLIYEAGIRYFDKQQYDSALTFFTELLKRNYYVQDSQTAREWVEVANQCGMLAFSINRCYQALFLFLDAHAVACKFGIQEPAPLLNASMLYAHEWNFEKAYTLCTQEEFLSTWEKEKDFKSSAQLLVSLLTCAMGMHDKEKVDTCLIKLSLPVYDTVSMAKFGLYRAQWWLALQNKEYDSALCFIEKALVHATAFSDTNNLYSSVYKDIADVWSQKENYDSALNYYNRSLSYAYQTNNLDFIQDIYAKKISLFDKLHEHKEYKEAVKLYTEISQVIKEEGRTTRQQNIDNIIHQRKQDREISELYYDQFYKAKIIFRQKIIILALSAVFCLILAFFYLLYLNKKRKARTNLILYEKTRKLLLLEQNRRFTEAEPVEVQKTPSATENKSPLDENQTLLLIEAIKRLLDEEECYTKEDFNLHLLSKMLNSNTLYVSRIINEYFHKSFSVLTNEYRVRKSCLLMNDPSNNSYTLEYISKMAGFGNRITFTQQFKKIVGMNPSDYWKLAKKKPE